MGQISLSLPQIGQNNSSEEPKIPADFTTIQNVINGNLDGTNLTAATAQAAGVNQAGQTVKGVSVIAGSESRTNTAYGTLTTPDQVTGIVMPTNGLIAVWYQATWQGSVTGAPRAAIFLNANQLVVAGQPASAPVTEAAVANGPTNTNFSLSSCPFGLVSTNATQGGGDVTTGQAVTVTANGTDMYYDLGGTLTSASIPIGGPCYVFAAAGVYTVSVQFKASSGSVTASNRKLWVETLAFS